MDDYAGRVLADRYRLPVPPPDEYEFDETRAFDTYSGQEVLIRQIPLPEVVDAEVIGADVPSGPSAPPGASGRDPRRPVEPAVRRAVEAAQAAAQVPDHPQLDQVFDVFAEAGSLWIVSELVTARPLAALLAEKPLSPYRAAEIGSDVLTALRALHVHGWTHRNITVRTVLVCDDGRVVLTGLAAGAAEEALCGYAPVPVPDEDEDGTDADGYGHPGADGAGQGGGPGHAPGTVPGPAASPEPGPEPGSASGPPYGASRGEPPAANARAARAGAIAAYRAGARAAARGAAAAAPLPPGPVVPPGGSLPSGYEPEPRWWSGSSPSATGEEDDGTREEPYEGAYGEAVYEETYGEPRETAYGESREAPYGEYDEDQEDGPRRAMLAGTWHDGPSAGRDGPGAVPAGGRTGGPPYGHGARAPRPGAPAPVHRGTDEALRADAQRRAPAAGAAATPSAAPPAGRWDDVVTDGPAPVHRGPTTPLAAERARQTRIAVVGAVTERWAPEQAGPVHETWQLAPPIGPATDLWALGALLYRAVQGHAPYPEENAAELVQMVCSEPPAFAEECGPLRPVVESLLRQDPTERPEVEELRGWLRSLIRSAPEPGAGTDVVPMPSLDGARLPIVRRRGELVRRRRSGASGAVQGRHRHKKEKPPRGHTRAPRAPRTPRARGPRALGRVLLLAILLALAAAVAYAVMFMPKSPPQGAERPGPGQSRSAPAPTAPAGSAPTSQDPSSQDPSPRAPSTHTGTPATPALVAGYAVREDPEGFRIGVDKEWRRSPINDAGQVRYTGGDYTLIVVPGRDTVRANGGDPMEYQRTKERELQPWRDSSWATATGLRRVDVGRQAMAEGQFTWQDSNGREVYVRNLALIVDGRYHVIQVIGPDGQRDKVTEIYRQAVTAYQATR